MHSTGIEYSDDLTEEISESIPFSPNFLITAGIRATGYKNGFRVRNNRYDVVFRAKTKKKRKEFVAAIEAAYNSVDYCGGEDRYGSSFIVRHDNLCRWYVDAKQYFCDVYHALSAAKKFVYICD